jgi:hypothetical protein
MTNILAKLVTNNLNVTIQLVINCSDFMSKVLDLLKPAVKMQSQKYKLGCFIKKLTQAGCRKTYHSAKFTKFAQLFLFLFSASSKFFSLHNLTRQDLPKTWK